MDEIRVINALFRKDVSEWLHQPRNIVVTFLPSVLFVIILALSVAAVGKNKVALVIEDNGTHAQQLAAGIESFDAFIITQATAQQAADLLNSLQIEAVITIPAGFEDAYTAHKPDPVTIEVNNFNLDFTNDLRRSLPAAITDFYASQPNNPVQVQITESDLRPQDISLLQYQIVPMLVQLLTVAGVVNTGLAMAREWEEQTIKELYLAPIKRRDIIAGKVLAGWFITLVFGALAFILAAVSGFFHPQGIYWLTTLLAAALIGLMSVALGVALAAILRKEQRVIGLGIALTFYLFFLSGGITVVAFLPDWLRTLAQFIPTYYGVHAMQMAVFYNSSELLGRDVAVLLLTTVVIMAVGVAAMRRREM